MEQNREEDQQGLWEELLVGRRRGLRAASREPWGQGTLHRAQGTEGPGPAHLGDVGEGAGAPGTSEGCTGPGFEWLPTAAPTPRKAQTWKSLSPMELAQAW